MLVGRGTSMVDRQAPYDSPADPPKKVGDLLDRLLRSLGAPSAPAIRSLFEAWPTIAGPDLADLAEPVRMTEDELVVVVGDPAWAGQLRWRSEEILSRCEDETGVRPREILVRVDRRRSVAMGRSVPRSD